MRSIFRFPFIAAVLSCAVFTANASDWRDLLQPPKPNPSEASNTGNALSGLLGTSNAADLLSSLGVPATNSISNAAGLLTYCVQHNYLNTNKAEQVKTQLLEKIGLSIPEKEQPKDPDYLSGLAGLITGNDGQNFSMDKLKGSLKEKACDFVLSNAGSLL